MNLKESYNRNKKKHLLKEVSAVAVGGGIGTHQGRGGKRGMEVDDVYGGPFHPDSGHGSQNAQLLTKQLDRRKEFRIEMEKILGKENIGIENPVGGWYDIETPALIATYQYMADMGAIASEWNAEMTPDLDPNWYQVDFEGFKKLIDKRIKQHKEDMKVNKKFMNTSETEMQSVDINIDYDKIIDKTEENKKFINDTNGWKSIYDSKEY